MKRLLGIGTAAAFGVAVMLASPANAQTVAPEGGTLPSVTASGVIHVPSDFDHALSDTRATGHYEVQGTGLRISTDGSGDIGTDGKNSDKVAEYVDSNTQLSGIGEPSLDYTSTFGTDPGYQLVVDFDNDGTPDGILVGEPGPYGNDWWASGGSAQFVKNGAPVNGGGFGSQYHGTLDQWRAAFPTATVKAFGFSLGSGVHGDGVINTITFNGTTYTFAADVVLTGKDQCKNGGWSTSTKPVFKNQGACVSSFVSKR